MGNSAPNQFGILALPVNIQGQTGESHGKHFVQLQIFDSTEPIFDKAFRERYFLELRHLARQHGGISVEWEKNLSAIAIASRSVAKLSAFVSDVLDNFEGLFLQSSKIPSVGFSKTEAAKFVGISPDRMQKLLEEAKCPVFDQRSFKRTGMREIRYDTYHLSDVLKIRTAVVESAKPKPEPIVEVWTPRSRRKPSARLSQLDTLLASASLRLQKIDLLLELVEDFCRQRIDDFKLSVEQEVLENLVWCTLILRQDKQLAGECAKNAFDQFLRSTLSLESGTIKMSKGDRYFFEVPLGENKLVQVDVSDRVLSGELSCDNAESGRILVRLGAIMTNDLNVTLPEELLSLADKYCGPEGFMLVLVQREDKATSVSLHL